MFTIIKADPKQGRAVSVIPVLYEDPWLAQQDAETLNKNPAHPATALRFVVIQCPSSYDTPAPSKSFVPTPILSNASLFEILAAPIHLDESGLDTMATQEGIPGFLDMD